MNERENLAILVDKILAQVRVFKTNSENKDSMITSLMSNPTSVDTKVIQDKIKESAEIVKILFELVDELDTSEGHHARYRNK
tara:strand:- start:104 stop:349 length:246 start_codon:yes stop_codon:yes gene_type:complete